jgi:MraZ protein
VDKKGMNTAFVGKYSTCLDTKGRVVMPAKLREIIRRKGMDGVYLVFNSHHITIYPPLVWEERRTNFYNKITTSSTVDSDLAKWYCYTNAYSSYCDMDRQGRILLPADLRDKAGITKDIVITGNQETIEIWSKECWEQFEQEMEAKKDEFDKKGILF